MRKTILSALGATFVLATAAYTNPAFATQTSTAISICVSRGTDCSMSNKDGGYLRRQRRQAAVRPPSRAWLFRSNLLGGDRRRRRHRQGRRHRLPSSAEQITQGRQSAVTEQRELEGELS